MTGAVDPMQAAEAALVAAGFVGIERVGDVIFARDGAEAAEFTVEAAGASVSGASIAGAHAAGVEGTGTGADGSDGPGPGGLRLALRFAVRATEAEQAAWMRAHPAGRLRIVGGETELSMVLRAGSDRGTGLAQWRDLMRAAAPAAVVWRRRQRPLHGM